MERVGEGDLEEYEEAVGTGESADGEDDRWKSIAECAAVPICDEMDS
jgi:hypothetical protein